VQDYDGQKIINNILIIFCALVVFILLIALQLFFKKYDISMKDNLLFGGILIYIIVMIYLLFSVVKYPKSFKKLKKSEKLLYLMVYLFIVLLTVFLIIVFRNFCYTCLPDNLFAYSLFILVISPTQLYLFDIILKKSRKR
jgi:uncharacterized membrane protein YozB (DUF420 family)